LLIYSFSDRHISKVKHVNMHRLNEIKELELVTHHFTRGTFALSSIETIEKKARQIRAAAEVRAPLHPRQARAPARAAKYDAGLYAAQVHRPELLQKVSLRQRQD
jgi:hypothetical protein